MDFSPHMIHLGELNHTPLGDLRIAVSDVGLVAVEWADAQPKMYAYLLRLKLPVEQNQRQVQPYAKEIREYLRGKRHKFTFSIDWATLHPFQRKMLKVVYEIPYGETRTYADIAAQIGHPNAY